jgi:hypothetical protein
MEGGTLMAPRRKRLNRGVLGALLVAAFSTSVEVQGLDCY